MSILDDVLKEEYDRLSRMRFAMSSEYNALPKGSLSKKTFGDMNVTKTSHTPNGICTLKIQYFN